MSNANTLEHGMLALINDERAAAGLDPLRPITLLNDAAETHSKWMLEADQFTHDGEGGSSPSDRMEQADYPFQGNSLALENIGWQSARGNEGFADDVAQIHDSLMISPGHRANILNPEAEDIGIGVEIGTFSGANGDFQAVMVTQVFGATDADIGAWIDPGTEDADDDIIDEPEDQIAEDLSDTKEPTDVKDTPADPVDQNIPEEIPQEDNPDDLLTICEPDIAMIDDISLPCDLSKFTVDLSNAFEFKREGDHLVWETSQEQLVTTFMSAFAEWVVNSDIPKPSEPQAIDISGLMVDGTEGELPEMFLSEAGDDTDEWLSQSCA